MFKSGGGTDLNITPWEAPVFILSSTHLEQRGSWPWMKIKEEEIKKGKKLTETDH